MKECPICHAKYDDSLNFCTNDGHQLVSVAANAVDQQVTSPQNSPQKKKGGCLKKIIIAVVVVIVGLVLLYNHLTNAATYLRTEPSAVGAAKSGGSCKVSIDYDGYIWTINHKPDWVDIDENENDFELEVEPNRTGQAREGSITIQSGKLLSQVVIKQNGVATYVKASETSVRFDEDGGSEDITIETDGCEWQAEYTNWMTVTKEDDETLHIKCPRNSDEYRTGTITVKEDYATVSISVSQGGKCNNCHGSGEINCTMCMGTGGFGFGMYYSNCMSCGGRGKFQCGACQGTGHKE